MAPLLEIKDLHTEIRLRRSTVHAIDGVNLTVDPGECLGIVGESGSGKTMTALSVMRLLPNGGHITGGSITLDGQDITNFDDEAMQDVRGNLVGMIFQDPMTSLNPTMTIGDQIAESVRLHRGADKEAGLERAVEVLGLVGMPKPAERIGNFPHQLSGGMRQRVMIAMALACEPKLLIADEPTTALDVTIQKQILELLDNLRQRLGMAVILVTHDLGVIAGRADRVAVMYAGRVVETTDTATLFANPRHPYTQALFEALPDKIVEPAGVAKRLYNIPGQPPDLTNPPQGCRFAARCRYVQDSCRETEPDLKGDVPLHEYRCFFPVGEAALDKPAEDADAPTVAAAEAEAEAEAAEGAIPVLATAPSVDGATADGTLLKVEHLVKEFPVTAGAIMQRRVGSVSAVADVSFEVPRGKTFGMVGESGCGKTTIGRLIVGLENANSGSIIFDGQDLTELSYAGPAAEQRQDPAHVPGLLRVDGPEDAGEHDPARAAGDPAPGQPEGAGKAGRRDHERGRPAPGRAGPLSARILRRPAAAARPGPGAHPAAEHDRGRRAGVGAGRIHPGADPEPDAGPAAGQRPDVPVHLARPLGGPVPLGHHRGHVPGQAGRGRPGRRRVLRPRPPVHEGPHRHGARWRTRCWSGPRRARA